MSIAHKRGPLLSAALAVLALSFAANSAHATLITEAYTGQQNVGGIGGPNNLQFNFDLRNAGSNGGTNSTLNFTTDGINAAGTWFSGTLFLDLFSDDLLGETATVQLVAFGPNSTLFTRNFAFNGCTVALLCPGGTSYNLSIALTQSELDALDNQGQGRVTLSAILPALNNFEVRRVAMSVEVPEPTTLALFALALIGAGVVARRRTA